MKAEKFQGLIKQVSEEFHKKIVGQDELLEGLLIALLCQGHVLVEGVPGLAKTLAVKTFSEILDLNFKRIQFVPDLLPSDIVGTEIFNTKLDKFTVKKGPLFSNLILADEINRAPAKVQSALLEAMQERQITIGEKTFPLNFPFMVLATQNPIEQEGTYVLPEAQVDRFMIKVKLNYPGAKEEIEIVKNNLTQAILEKTNPILKLPELKKIINAYKQVHLEDKIIEYIIGIVEKTRNLSSSLVSHGASPRASIFLSDAVKALAYINGNDYVSPDDVKHVAPLILEHRIVLSYEAEADNITKKEVVDEILSKVKVP